PGARMVRVLRPALVGAGTGGAAWSRLAAPCLQQPADATGRHRQFQCLPVAHACPGIRAQAWGARHAGRMGDAGAVPGRRRAVVVVAGAAVARRPPASRLNDPWKGPGRALVSWAVAPIAPRKPMATRPAAHRLGTRAIHAGQSPDPSTGAVMTPI